MWDITLTGRLLAVKKSAVNKLHTIVRDCQQRNKCALHEKLNKFVNNTIPRDFIYIPGVLQVEILLRGDYIGQNNTKI